MILMIIPFFEPFSIRVVWSLIYIYIVFGLDSILGLSYLAMWNVMLYCVCLYLGLLLLPCQIIMFRYWIRSKFLLFLNCILTMLLTDYTLWTIFFLNKHPSDSYFASLLLRFIHMFHPHITCLNFKLFWLMILLMSHFCHY